MKGATIPSSKTKESDAHTNLAFCLPCERAHRPVERWMVYPWIVSSFGHEQELKYRRCTSLVYFSAFFNENERGFPTVRDGSPNHHQRRLLATENRFHGCGDAISALFVKILSFCELNLASTGNIFSSEKMISPPCVPFFITFKRIFDLSNLFCFCNVVSYCLLVIFKGDNLRSSLTMVLPLFSSIAKLQAIFLMLCMGVPLYSLPNGFNFGLCASSSGRPHLSQSLHVPSSLQRITSSLTVDFTGF